MAQDENNHDNSDTPADQADDVTQTSGEAASEPEQAGAAEIADLKDQVLRSLAEMENVKRRAARDIENAHKFAVEKLLNDLFPVVDSLEKAVETAEQTQGAQPIAEGVALSLKLFVDTFAKSGVEQIDPLGEPFDPQLHEAMAMVPNPAAEPNSVMDVMQKGYLLNGRLVRAAKVIVAKAPDA
jgi:molecular chaperone GrpE